MSIPPFKYDQSAQDVVAIREEIGLVGNSSAVLQILQTIQQVAPTDISVLIFGESGSGKELVAQAIHALSRRSDKPFVVVNAGAIPEGLIESELFGHEKGAFTGAIGSRKGYFEQADGGTIFLDEIGEMPLAAQVKLLRTLEGREYLRVGGSGARQADVRVIAASNKDLAKAVAAGEFRQDLFYRLNAVNLRVPPLRERQDDIPLLVKKFVNDFCERNKISFAGFTDAAIARLAHHHWPGNVRELKNFVESIIVMESGRRIDEHTLSRYFPPPHAMDSRLPVPITRPPEELEREFIYRALVDLKSEIAQLRELLVGRYISPFRRLKSGIGDAEVIGDSGSDLQNGESQTAATNDFKSLDEMERSLIFQALERTGGNKRKAAKLLRISERTLYRKIREFDLPF
jgi:DNA-binding NtrC family response regulator